MTTRTLTFGTHNLHDDTGVPTGFADILFFTEALPEVVKKALADAYHIEVCKWQKDLIIAWRKSLGATILGKPRYIPAHSGIAKVTPHRGVFIVKIRLWGRRVKLICEHRINAAFPPYVRGERFLRPKFWRLHTAIAKRVIRHALKRGWVVLAGGDLNTPRKTVDGYAGLLHEVGDGIGKEFDRLGASLPIHSVDALSKKGSDHPRIKGAVEFVLAA